MRNRKHLNRKRHRKDTAAAGAAVHTDRTVVEFYDLQCDRKTQPEVSLGASGFFCPVKAVEDLCLIFRRDADTGIRHSETEVVLLIGQCEVDAAALRRVADGVGEQNREQLGKAVGIGMTQWQGVLRQRDGEGQLFICRQRFKAFVSE